MLDRGARLTASDSPPSPARVGRSGQSVVSAGLTSRAARGPGLTGAAKKPRGMGAWHAHTVNASRPSVRGAKWIARKRALNAGRW